MADLTGPRAALAIAGRGSLPRALAAMLAVLVLMVGACEGAPGSPSGPRQSPGSCAAHVLSGVLPSWARAGFNEPRPRMNYELGRDHDIAAILWKDPLLAPPSATARNKILWVSRVSVSGSPLFINAQRLVGSKPVGPIVRRRVDGGPGPSIVNLAAGCWRLTLRWSGHSDSLDIRYIPAAREAAARRTVTGAGPGAPQAVAQGRDSLVEGDRGSPATR